MPNIPESIRARLLNHAHERGKESVVAEKFEAMVLFGITNTRMKDFYDVWALANEYTFEGPTLSNAIQATFARRKTPLPQETTLALTRAFYEENAKLR